MHIHRYYKLLLRPSLQQQDYNISTLPIQQPDTAATNDVMYGNNDDDDNATKSNMNPDDLVNQWKIPIRNNFALDDKVNLYSVQQQYTRFLLEMREQHILPQTVIQPITTHIVNLLDDMMDFVEEKAIQENIVLYNNIPDIFRSILQCIHLVAICNTKYLNDDMKMKNIYYPIISDLNDLQSSGLIINTFNSQIYFTFTTMAANNLAAHEVDGFQQSFSFGYICRRCLITYENRLIPLTDVYFVRRVAMQHQCVLQSLENNPQIKSICGIVGPSPLNDLRNFNSSSSLPGDVMHDLFEGVCPLIIMAMLKEASSSRLNTFSAIQTRTENFIYGALDTSNKSPPIQIKHLNNDCITRIASQKFCLFRLFIMLSDIVDHLQLFKIYLISRELLDMVLALPQRKNWIPFMETLAINFHCGNGLFDDVFASKTTKEEMESQLLDLIKRHCPEKRCPLASSSIHWDREVARLRMPSVSTICTIVSSMSAASIKWCNDGQHQKSG
ncbi:unnamed protein product [Rotaria socialis]|uniref:Uncharacterized protein n=1 Tax=Rotaria socialis TaxID=392032 RepID=A0A821SR68_9BILA|nr:unnamed protein product [Rotaria socialis]